MAKVEQKQHVDLYRKVLLRKQLLKDNTPKIVYVPFIGDGDIASQLYQDAEIHGADIDSGRVATAFHRLPKADIVVADCNKWVSQFTKGGPYDTADFDAYSDPYEAFRAFWQEAPKAHTLTLFFTDGHKQGIMRTGNWITPDGDHLKVKDTNEKRDLFNFYYQKHVLPWFQEYIKPYKILQTRFYLRGQMLYWGAIITDSPEVLTPSDPAASPLRTAYKFDKATREKYLDARRDGLRIGDAAKSVGISRQTIYDYREKRADFKEREDQATFEANEHIEDALYQAARSGNVSACIEWLSKRDPERWGDKPNPQVINQFSPTVEVKNDSIDERIAKYAEHFAKLDEQASATSQTASNGPGQ